MQRRRSARWWCHASKRKRLGTFCAWTAVPHTGHSLRGAGALALVRVRLIEIGEAVKDLQPAVLEREPGLPWRSIVGMRDRLALRYFHTDHAIVTATCERDLPELREAVERLAVAIDDDA